MLSEDPAGFGFGTAALALTPKFLFHPSTVDGHPRLAWVTIPINFDLGGGAMGPKRPPPPTGSRVNDRSDIGPVFTLVSSAPWTRTPSSADVQAAYPTHAKPATAFGHVVLVCDFTKEGDLRNCVTNIETPGGQGFGQAAKSLLRLFHLDPATAPGTDLSKVRINLAIHFSRPDAQTRRVIDHPDWISAGDSGGDLFPDAARKAGLATGRAVLDCIADPAGKMSGCQVVSEDPAGLGFGAEALRTAEAMAVNRWTSGGQPVDGAHLIFAVRINKDDGKSTQKPAAVPPG